VTDFDYGLQIISVSDPSNPYLLGHCWTPGSANGVFVQDSLAYVADWEAGLQIISVSDLSNPYLLGSYATPEWAMGVFVQDNLAYVADMDAGLQIVSVSDPSNPYLLGSYDTPGYAYGVFVQDSLAYVADYYGGLQIISVSDPSNPYVSGSYDTPGRARGVFVQGKHVYVADVYSLIILETAFDDPPDPFSLLFPPNKAFTARQVRFDWETATDPNPFDTVRYDLYVSTSYHFPPAQTTVDADLVASEHTKILDYGTYYWRVKAKDRWGVTRWSDQIRHFMVTGIAPGDLNGDGSIDIADVVFSVNYLFASGPAPDPLEAGDVNCDGTVDVADVTYLINYLFIGGPPPVC